MLFFLNCIFFTLNGIRNLKSNVGFLSSPEKPLDIFRRVFVTQIDIPSTACRVTEVTEANAAFYT